MKVITLDGSRWTDIPAFYEDLLSALEAPEWHGTGLDALFDSMIGGDINGVEPPYRSEIDRASDMPREVEAYVALVAGVGAGRAGGGAGRPRGAGGPGRR